MNEPAAPDRTADALRRFRERVRAFCDHITGDYHAGIEDNDWPAVIVQEAAYMVQHGPAAYVAYVDRLDADARDLTDMDQGLRLILGDGKDPE